MRRSALNPKPMAMGRLFGAIAAHRHAAPPSAPSPCMVREDERAALSFTRPDVGEVLVAHASRQRFADRQQERFGRSPPPRRLQLQTIAVCIRTRRYATEHFVTLRSALRGPSSRIAFGVSGRPICWRTKPLNHSRKARAWSRSCPVRRAAPARSTLSAPEAEQARPERARRRGRRRCRASQSADRPASQSSSGNRGQASWR